MKRAGSAVWLVSFLFALVSHGAAVLAFAALHQNPAGVSENHIQLASLNEFSTTSMNETSSESSVASNSEPANLALKPVSTSADVLAESTRETLTATKPESPAVSELSNSVPADPVVNNVINKAVEPETSVSEVPTAITAGKTRASTEMIAELTEKPEMVLADQSPSERALAVATAVAGNPVNTETNLPEAAIVSPVVSTPIASETGQELAELPAPPAGTNTSISESAEQTNNVSVVLAETAQLANSASEENTISKEEPVVTEQSAQAEASDGIPESSSGLGETQDNSASNTAPEEQLALVVPNVAPVKPPIQPDPPKPADVKGIVEGFDGGPCFLSFPEQDQTNKWRVRSYSDEKSSFGVLAAHLEKNGAMDILQQDRTIQNLQCGAISFARTFATKTDDRFKIAVQSNLVQDGSDLNFVVSGFDQKWLYITMIDDDGIATDVSPYAKMEGADVRLTMPVHVKNAGKYRSQLLLAISSDQPLTLLDIPEPRPFAEVLPLIRGNIIAAKAKVIVAIADFSVE